MWGKVEGGSPVVVAEAVAAGRRARMESKNRVWVSLKDK